MNRFIQLIKGRCPRCGEGRVFEEPNPYNLPKMLKVRKRCGNCNLDFSPEIGFYWGATYVDYALTVAFSGFTFVISTLIFGFMNSLNLYYVAVNGALLIIFCPLFSGSRAFCGCGWLMSGIDWSPLSESPMTSGHSRIRAA